jgi:hypothetical protein
MIVQLQYIGITQEDRIQLYGVWIYEENLSNP